MKRALGLIAIIFSCSVAVQAQITITGTVKDSNGSIYAGGSGKVTSTATGLPMPISQLDSFGKFSVSLPLPSNQTWIFSFCSAQYSNPVTNYCFTMMPLTLTTSQDITSTITPQAALLPTSGGGSGGGSAPVGSNNDVQIKLGTVFGSGVVNAANIGPTGNIFGKSASGNSMQYVSPQGNDSYDGLSWLSSKKTIFAAMEALPGGSSSPAQSGIGTIYVADQTQMCAITTYGIQIMGPNDPNYSSPPTCWVRQPAGGLNIIGVPTENTGPNQHAGGRVILLGGSSTDTVHPGIWLSNTTQPIQFENLTIQYPGRGIVIGEWSNGAHPGVDQSGVSTARFVNVGAEINQAGTNGPSWDIWGGSFWDYFINCGGDGNGTLSGTANGAQSFYFHTAADGNSSGFIVMTDINTSYGSIKIETGTNTGVGFSINGVSQESGAAPAAVWITGNNQLGQLNLQNIGVADAVGTLCNGSVCGVENDDTAIAPEQVVVINSSGNKGPMLLEGAETTGGGGGIGSNSVCSGAVYVNGQEGFSDGCVYADSDLGRRLFSPAAVRFPNIASTVPSAWDLPAGVTLAQNISAPDGSLGAGRVTNTNASLTGPYFFGAPGGTNISTALNDWFIYGIWTRYNSGPGWHANTQAAISFASCNATFSSGTNNLVNGPTDGNWVWEWSAVKIATLPGGTTCGVSMSEQLNISSTETADFYGPVLIHIPAGTIPDSEVQMFAHNLAPYNSTCSVGTLCNVQGPSFPIVAATIPPIVPICNTPITMPTSLISSGAASTAGTGTCTAVATSAPFDSVACSSGATDASANGALFFYPPYVSSNAINEKYGNGTAGSLTPSATTLQCWANRQRFYSIGNSVSTANGSTGASVTSGSISVSAGQALVIAASGCDGSGCVTGAGISSFTVTDSASDSVTCPAGLFNVTGSGYTFATQLCYVCNSAGSGSMTFSVTAVGATSPNFVNVGAFAVNGAATSSCEDSSVEKKVSVYDNNPSATSGAVSQPGEFIVGLGRSQNGPTANQTNILTWFFSQINLEWAYGPVTGTQALSWAAPGVNIQPAIVSIMGLKHP